MTQTHSMTHRHTHMTLIQINTDIKIILHTQTQTHGDTHREGTESPHSTLIIWTHTHTCIDTHRLLQTLL